MMKFAKEDGIKYRYGSGGGSLSGTSFSEKEDEEYRDPWFTFRAMLRHYSRDDDFMYNDSGIHQKEYKALVSDWLDVELKNLDKFMKKYIEVAVKFGDEEYNIKKKLQKDLVYEPLKKASKKLKEAYAKSVMGHTNKDISDKLGL